jgi:hypothetical protein
MRVEPEAAGFAAKIARTARHSLSAENFVERKASLCSSRERIFDIPTFNQPFEEGAGY